jgi:hypothetical protein
MILKLFLSICLSACIMSINAEEISMKYNFWCWN